MLLEMLLVFLYRARLLSSLLLPAWVLAGCAPKPLPPNAAQVARGPLPLVAAPLSPPAMQPQSGAIIPPRLAGASASYGAQTPLPGAGTPPPEIQGGSVSLNFADTDIRAVVAQVLGTILHVTYTIDPAVHGKATLHTTNPMPVADLIPTLQTLLEQNQAELVADNGMYRVIPESAAGAAMAGANALGGATVVPLQYVDAAHLAAVLQPYVGKGGRVIAAPGRNALIVDGDPQTRNTLIQLISAFDVDALAGQSYILFPATGDGAKDFATAFTAALHAGKDTGSIRVVPLERIGAVMVIAPSVAQIAQANRIYAVLVRQDVATRRVWHVYYLRNSAAEDVAHVLQEAFTPNDVTAQPTSSSTGQTAPGLTAQNLGGTAGNTPGGSSGVTSPLGTTAGGVAMGATGSPGGGLGGATPAVPAVQPASQPSDNPLLGPLGGSAGGGDDGNGTRIIAAPQQNAILVYATESTDATVHAMLRKIDIEPLEVEIDATIAEVDLNTALQYGTQFFFKSGGINGVLSQGTTSSLVQNFPGFVLSGYGADVAPLAISALQSVTKVRVLSSPQLMVQNDRTANLLVGNLVPYLSQTSQSTITTGAPVINSINYQETGVILQITPRISNDGMVALDVSQQVSGVAPSVTTQGLNSPTFSERAVSSSVVVHDGQTIGLAGLITDNDQRGNSGLPFLKDIPVLGALFSSQNNTRARTELLVLITPHVVHDQIDAASLTQDLQQALPEATLVPAQLNGLPADGSSDPNARLRTRLGLH
ncbi:MAG: type II secretion system secretin GspD [Acidiphilium sp.]|nr:type II secretion system secretin GspD [Acidiphilium sp.]MDD4935620.1 type II secretion system secretin GspD [Acidiphilium sp.]